MVDVKGGAGVGMKKKKTKKLRKVDDESEDGGGGGEEDDEGTELTVEDILALGGEKEDLAMLAGIDDGGDDCDIGGGGSAEELKLDDIQSFVKKLGLPGFSAKTKARDKSKTVVTGKEQQQKQTSEQSEKEEERPKREKKKKQKKQKLEAMDTSEDSASAISGGPEVVKPESKVKKTEVKTSKVTNSEPVKKRQKSAESEIQSTVDSTPKDKPQTSVSKPPLKQQQQSSAPAETAVTSTNDSQEDPASKKKKNKKKKKKDPLVQLNEVSSSCSQSPEPPIQQQQQQQHRSPSFDSSIVSKWSSAHKVRRNAIVKPGGRWFEQTPADALVDPEDRSISKETLARVEEFASQLLRGDAACFQQSKTKFMKGDMAFIGKIINTGTLNDKTAAQTLLIQESPVHSLDNMDGLIAMAKKKGRREALMALSTLKDLFVADLLPEDRKLIPFDRRPLARLDEIVSGNSEAREKRLILWKFEDELKKRFLDFVKAVETLLSDNLVESRKQALNVNFDLLRSTPEQEGLLLEMLVNKLGDPDYKVAAKVVHLLGKLVQEHTDMDAVVVRKVEILLFRPNVKQKAQYYALCFLNNLILSRRKTDLAESLLNIYFCCFNRYVKAGEVESKMLSSLLLGVNRAFPFATKSEGAGAGGVDDQIEKHLQTIFRVVHTAHFNVSVQALMLLFQILGTREEIQDRFYRALYVKLMDPELERSSRQAMFLNLIYKALMRDEAEKRVKAFVKRFLQVSSHLSPPFICGVLVILSHVLAKHKSFFSFNKFMSGMSTLDSGTKMKEGEEEAKEGEKAQDVAEEDSDDEEETFKDVEEDVEEKKTGEEKKKETTTVTPAKQSSWVHRDNLSGGCRPKNPGDSSAGKYDPLSRNPLYCGADQAVVYELNSLVNHFHPSVSLFARRILLEEEVGYNGDPLVDFTLSRFLERFVYKNPKKVLETLEKNHSAVIQSRKKRVKVEGVKKIAVNSKEYLDLAEEKIPVDEQFFRQFFAQKRKLLESKKTEKKDEMMDDVDDDEFDKFLKDHHENVDEYEADFAAEAGKSGGTSLEGLKKRKRKNDDSDDEDDDDDEDFGEDEPDEEDDDSDEDMEDEGMEKDEEMKLDEKAVKELDEAVDSEIDEELDEILKGGGVEDDDDELEDFDGWDGSDGEGGEEEEDEEDLDEENIAFSGSEDEFQPIEVSSRSSKETKKSCSEKGVKTKSAEKQPKSKKLIVKDDDEDEGDEDLDEFDFIEKMSNKKQKVSKKKAAKGNKLADLFADAEEFSHLLEGNVSAGKGGRGFDMLGLGAMSNKDRASMKQLEWESGRDKKVMGEDWRKKGKPGRKSVGGGKKPPGKSAGGGKKPHPAKIRVKKMAK